MVPNGASAERAASGVCGAVGWRATLHRAGQLGNIVSKTLQELTRSQREFDLKYESFGRSWATPITQDNIQVLLELVVALAGEVGEVANLAKKTARGDFTLEEARGDLAGELADVLIYVLKIADQLQVDLEGALTTKMQLNARRFAHFERDHGR
jgi:NTP pyrophosphatase (non-canonical NTP hydrolase)